MTQAAKAQEPSMEEILASIRRIIADDDASKPTKAPEAAPAAKQQAAVTAAPSRPAPTPAPAKTTAPPPASAAANSQDDIDAMLAELEDAPVDEASTPDVLDLTEAMAAPAPSSPPAPSLRPAPGFRTIDGASDVVFTTKPEPPPLIDRGLISNETIAAVDRAFNTLTHTLIGQNARTLEDLVKEMLRPMLKSWLDDNLPSLVERIVRAEIERVSRGR
jgi:uncharacterized protein